MHSIVIIYSGKLQLHLTCLKLSMYAGMIYMFHLYFLHEQPPRGYPWVPWVSGLVVGRLVQTWPDSECSHTVQFLVQFSDCKTITFFSSGLCDIIIII